MVCFDLVTPSTTHVITFQVTVDTIPDQGLLINEALHENDAPGTLEEAAVAVVQLPWAEPKINEFSVNHVSTDTEEYLEIIGSPNADYSAYAVLSIEGDYNSSNSSEGFIDRIVPLGITDANGLFLSELPNDALENGTMTLLLVKDNTAVTSNDIDTNDDGVIDNTYWSEIADEVAIHDGGASDLTYGVPVLGVAYDGFAFAPGAASRIPDGFDTDSATDWVRNDFDLAGIPGYVGTPTYGEAYNTPGAFNEIVKVVTFNVTIPDFTPVADTIYIVGDEVELGEWDPGLIAMTKVDDTHWTIDIIFEEETELEFKFTRGSWDTVIMQADGNTDIEGNNLLLTVAYDETGRQVYDYTVMNWQDPLITAVTPLDGSVGVSTLTTVTTTWSQSVAANSCFTLADAVPTDVAGTCAYDDATKTITFTPDAALAQDTLYTATASDIVDLGGYMQKTDYIWSFTTNAQAPVAVADSYTTDEDVQLVVAAAEGVLANDTDDGPLTAELVLDAANGTLALAADGSFTYLPDLDFNGEDSFTYKAFDGELYSETVTVTITVTPVNDAPEAVDDEYTVIEDGLLEVAAPGVLANDIEVDLDNMVVSLVTNVEHGSLILLGDGSFTYQPDEGFSGIDTFVYQLVTYPNGIQAEWTDEATVTITVTPLPRIYLPLIFK